MQPNIRPASNKLRVHEKVCLKLLSSHTPRAAPNKVGTAIDQPTIPNNPKPDHTLLFWRCASSFLSSLSPTSLLKDGSLFALSSSTNLFLIFENYAENLFLILP